MQDLGYELPRIPIPRTWVNKGKRKGRGPDLLIKCATHGRRKAEKDFLFVSGRERCSSISPGRLPRSGLPGHGPRLVDGDRLSGDLEERRADEAQRPGQHVEDPELSVLHYRLPSILKMYGIKNVRWT
jgi:hypothetical protein